MGLTGDLRVSVQSLLNATEAMDVTSTNIANLNTPGYARRVLVMEEDQPTGTYPGSSGAQVASVHTIRDKVVDMAINAKTSEQNANSTLSTALSAVQTEFSDTTAASIGTGIDSFFSALQSLSTSPTNTSMRAIVLTKAGNVASAFQSTSFAIVQARQQADQSVVQSTSDANSILQQIAEVNQQLAISQAVGKEDNANEDRLSSLLTKLAGIMDYQTVNSSDGLTLTTTSGVPLVVGSSAYALTNQLDAAGFNQVYAGGVNITGTVQGGELGGYLQARDQVLNTLGTQLDQFAYDFAKAVNDVQTTGVDLNGNAGTALFNPPDTTTGNSAGAAAAITVALTSGAQIAASSSVGATADNSNLMKMIKLQSQAVSNGDTPAQAFSGLTFQVGNAISQANSNATAVGNILTQLQNQQSSAEHVSLEEETSNLILYQRSYQAAAKVISVIDNLMVDVLNMGASSGGYQ